MPWHRDAVLVLRATIGAKWRERTAMTFWTNDKLREAFSGGVVHPFDPSRIKQAAYEMGVASDYAITTPEGEGKRERAEGGNDIKIGWGSSATEET
jgi:hypothetical protein